MNTIVKKRQPSAMFGGKTIHRSVAAPAAVSLDRRAAGVLLHLTSLPGPHGSGDLGPAARAFADFLCSAGQRWWQMLPVAPPGAPPGYSPYSSDSALAGSPYLVSLETLAQERLLSDQEIAPRRGRGRHADFGSAISYRQEKLRLAFERFGHLNGPVRQAFEQFCQREKFWLDDYSLFCAIKDRHGGAEWCTWERDLRLRKSPALERARIEWAAEIEFHRFVQYQFDRQWRSFKAYCAGRGVGLIGDLPIFVAHDSADVWAHQHLFALDGQGRPTIVTGYPPDVFNRDGQRWGHPHFSWGRHKAENYRWWLQRFNSMLCRFDALRIDHFLGFDKSWSIPADSMKVADGQWIPGGGIDFFRAVRKELGNGAQMIAEDLGELTPAAAALRDRFGLRGMRVLQFAFGGDDYHRPHAYPRHCVAYTGTHDNDTIVGWYQKLSAKSRRSASARRELRRLRQYFGISDDSSMHWTLIRSLYASQANTAIIPMQDLLGLDTRSRMNVPGTCEGNWAWRLTRRQINRRLAQRLRTMAELFGRS